MLLAFLVKRITQFDRKLIIRKLMGQGSDVQHTTAEMMVSVRFLDYCVQFIMYVAVLAVAVANLCQCNS